MLSGIGTTGFILIVLIALLLFGPNKLPELGRAIGRTLREFKEGARDVIADDRREVKKEENKTLETQTGESQDNRRLPD